MNVEKLEIQAVHAFVWHKVGDKYSAPLINQLARSLQMSSQLTPSQMQEIGSEKQILDVVAIKDNTIWLVQVATAETPMQLSVP